MDLRSCQTQPLPTSRSTAPLTIPPPRPHTLNPSVNAEFQRLRFDHRQDAYPQFRHTPRGRSRPRTPPSPSPSPSLSSSPSPSPSASSYYTGHRDDDLEIEELTEDSDSGIELLVGEYEEAPENYRKELVYGSDEDIEAPHKSILYGLERLSAKSRGPSTVAGSKNTMRQRLQRESAFAIPMRNTKRSYAESSGSEPSSWGDSGMDSEEEGRKARRIFVRRGIMEDDCVSIHSYDGGSNYSSDNEIDMEL